MGIQEDLNEVIYRRHCMSIESTADLAAMRRVGRIVAMTIAEMRAAVRVGMTTAELDTVAAATFKRYGVRSAPQLIYGFPAHEEHTLMITASAPSILTAGG